MHVKLESPVNLTKPNLYFKTNMENDGIIVNNYMYSLKYTSKMEIDVGLSWKVIK